MKIDTRFRKWNGYFSYNYLLNMLLYYNMTYENPVEQTGPYITILLSSTTGGMRRFVDNIEPHHLICNLIRFLLVAKS